MTQEAKNQFKKEFARFAEAIANKIIDVYENAQLPDTLKDQDSGKLFESCVQASIQRWQNNLTSFADTFKQTMSDSNFISKLAEEANNINKNKEETK